MERILSTNKRGAAEDLECVMYEYEINFTLEEKNGEFIYTITGNRDELDGLVENEIDKNSFTIIK